MAITFPASPTNGQTFTSGNKTWQWDGTTWLAYGASLSPTVLKVDAANARVGINNQSPASAFDVVGTTTLKTVKAGSGTVAISSTSYTSLYATSTYNTSTPHGFATGDTVAVTGITPSSWNRTATITVASSTSFYFSLFNGSTGGAYSSGGTASGPPSTLYVDATNDRVGINNRSPAYALDVNGTIEATQYLQGTNYLSPYQGFRNKIINGGFEVWQRGINFNSIAANTYFADRWLVGGKDGGITLNVTRQPFTAGSAPVAGYEGTYYAQLANTAFVSTQAYYFGQKIEDVRTFAGQTVTISYWARVTSGTFTPTRVFFYQDFGSGGSAGVDNIGATSPTYTTTWTRYTQTINVPSISGKTVGTSSLLYLLWQIVPNANITLQIWGVQVEQGSVATPFEQRPIQQELALCQRYYEQERTTLQTMYWASDANGSVYGQSFIFSTPKRVAPTIRTYDAANTIDRHSTFSAGATRTDGRTNNLLDATSTGFSVRGYNVAGAYGYGFYWTADSEL